MTMMFVAASQADVDDARQLRRQEFGSPIELDQQQQQQQPELASSSCAGDQIYQQHRKRAQFSHAHSSLGLAHSSQLGQQHPAPKEKRRHR